MKLIKNLIKQLRHIKYLILIKNMEDDDNELDVSDENLEFMEV